MLVLVAQEVVFINLNMRAHVIAIRALRSRTQYLKILNIHEIMGYPPISLDNRWMSIEYPLIFIDNPWMYFDNLWISMDNPWIS